MDEIFLTGFLVFVAMVLLTYWIWHRRDIYKFAHEFPNTLWGLPIIGCFLSIGRISGINIFVKKQWKSCNTFCAFFMITPIILTTNPEVVRQILTQSGFKEKFKKMYDPVANAVGGGMLGARAENALHHRKILSAAFRKKQLLEILGTFNVKGNEFVKELDELHEAGGEVPDLLTELRLFNNSISRATIMGYNKKFSDSRVEISIYNKYLQYVHDKIFLDICLRFGNLGWLLKFNPFFLHGKRQTYLFPKKAILNREETEYSQEKVEHSENILLIDQAYKHFPLDALVGELNELLVASYETSAISLYSTLLLLAMHPEIQEHLFEEIVEIFPSKNINVEFEHLGQLTYLEMVINEALRLFPPAPIIGREVSEETPLEVDNKWYKLPKNMNIVIDIFGLHRNPNIWGPNADKFDPDNFLPHNVAKRSPYAFIPFSKGARICFGWTYAYMLLKTMLIHILRNYRLSTTAKYENIEVIMNLFLMYKEVWHIHLHRRP